jgi:NDP-sugar pyrophosphorylase family protein
MKAMVLAAGIGSRLRPLTDTRPKALVEIGGRTMLEVTLSRLRSFGIHDVIINVHHFAGMVVDYLKTNDNFGMRIEISDESDLLLDTGGGLKKAAWFFEKDEESFVLHNVDVISTIDLAAMTRFHQEHQPLATLAVQTRKTSRYLFFDENLHLCGRSPAADPNKISLGFAGIHIISPAIFPMMTEEGVFSIIPSYLRLAAEGVHILGFRADDAYWRDLGKVENIELAERDRIHGYWI